MDSETTIFYIFVIFTGSAVLATLALYARQALLVGYIILGVILGPPIFGVVSNTHLIEGIGDIGIIFLLFLLAINLQPQDLAHMLKKCTVVTAVSSLLIAAAGFIVAYYYGLTVQESLVIGFAITISSTIISLKLLPTTVLHHKHAGELIVGIALLQDLTAIILLLILKGLGQQGSNLWLDIFLVLINLPLMVIVIWFFERYVLIKLIRKFDKIQEYIFLMTIGWCLGTAQMGHWLGLSHEIGAFIGGVALASSPIARYIAESLKPLRDFFLVMFFFSLGASIHLEVMATVLIPAIVLAVVTLVIKPFIFQWLLMWMGEDRHLSFEMGVRLGQISEFSLLIAVVALQAQVISLQASYLLQAATILTFIASTYFVVLNYPTPIAVSDKLRRD